MASKKEIEFCKAIEDGDIEKVKRFIKNGIDINCEIYEGSFELCLRGEKGFSPLMIATTWDNVEMLKLLIENGAYIDQTDDRTQTVIDYAEINDAENCLSYLTELISKKESE
jgi:ankyrin repeat protein